MDKLTRTRKIKKLHDEDLAAEEAEHAISHYLPFMSSDYAHDILNEYDREFNLHLNDRNDKGADDLLSLIQNSKMFKDIFKNRGKCKTKFQNKFTKALSDSI